MRFSSLLVTAFLVFATASACANPSLHDSVVIDIDREITALGDGHALEPANLALEHLPRLIAEHLIAQAQRSGGAGRQAMAGDGAIAVLFPDVGEPYREVFLKIIEGIESRARTRIASIPVRQGMEPAELSAELRRQDIRVVIALGKQGMKAAAGLERGIEVVAGAVLSAAEPWARDNTVISLAPDPGLLFARLKTLQPGTQRVTVIYDPRTNDWLIHHARLASRHHGIELNALPAEDMKAALQHYRDFLAQAHPKRDALWLPQDMTTVEESAIVPYVLKETWDRGIPLFSSSLAHVRRGALFSLYPNNVDLGKELATSALAYLGGDRPHKGMSPLRELMAAVNTRTAGHLGINLHNQNFDLLLPEGR